ncbi:enoyl-CoA hydratase [Variovorax sp. M-6]|uniref:enoyl-CoA hydratase n=1 Tax=Variovorax sp. M-6 TaxID=3233041 RepID=UPI003F9A31CA
MSEGHIRIETAAGVGTLVISHAHKQNAMTLAMWKQLATAVQTLASDRAVRVLVLTGEGNASFVSGADISEFAQQRSGADAVATYDHAVATAQRVLAECAKPTVARIQGICMGGGIGIALACDLRFASSNARFRMPAARIGLGYAFEGMLRLVRLLGAPATFDLFYTARSFEAPEAMRLGLVNDSINAEAFDAEVASRVALISQNAPLALRAAKAAILATLEPPTAQAREVVDAMVRQCFASRDYAEGQAAFAERRAPHFEGN